MVQHAPCLARAIARVLSAAPDRHVMADKDRRFTAAEVLAIAAARASQLADHGVTAGDRVLVCNQRGVRFWIDLIALWTIGAQAVPLNLNMPANQAQVVIARTTPVAMITGNGLDPLNLAVPAISGEPEGTPGQSPEIRDKQPDAIAAILFTSGSTGQPKGVAETHAALLGNAYATQPALGLGPDDRLYMATPFLFISAVSHFLVCLLAGSEFIATEERLFKGDLTKRIRECRATWFGGSPIQARWIAEVAPKAPFPDLRAVMSSGDHLGLDVIAQLRRDLPQVSVVTVYGMTELAGRFCVLPPAEIDRKAGSVGHPIDGLELAILEEETGRQRGPEEAGEVVVKGRYVFAGYFNDAEATAECLDSGGFHTGDVGKLDKDGYLYLLGRKDDVFKYGGQKVSALPIADLLMKTDAFDDVVVAGAPDDVHGHVPYVFYVPRDGREPDLRAVMTRVREELPASHRPASFVRVNEIPRTGSGKVLRAWLRQQVKDALERRSGNVQNN